MASYFRQVPNFAYVSRNPGEHQISNYIPVKNLFKRGKLRDDIFGNLNFFEKYSIIGDERPDSVAYKFYNDSTLDWVVLLSNNILNIQSEWPLTQESFDKVMLNRYGSYENLYSGIHHYETSEIKNSLGATVLPAGIKLENSWRTNGNFIEVINTKINQIFAGSAGVPSTTVTVTMNNGIAGLEVGSQVYINNISEKIYNGRFIVTSVLLINNVAVSFTYELPEVPDVANPVVSTSGKEEVIFTVKESVGGGNAHYYEYWDPGLGYSVLVSSSSFVNEITNYQYELQLEEAKRNIYVLKPRYLNIVFNDMDDLMPYKQGSTQYVSRTFKKGDNIRLYT